MENQNNYVDEERYNEIKAVMGDKFPQFLDIFFENTETHLEQAGAYLAANELDGVHRHIHPLISTSAALGALTFTRIAMEINVAIENNTAEHATISKQYEELISLYDVIKTLLLDKQLSLTHVLKT